MKNARHRTRSSTTCRALRRPSPADGQLHPVLNRRVLDLAHAPDVSLFDRVGNQDVAAAVDDPHRPGVRDLEGLVVLTVLFGFLGHQPDVGDAANRSRVERPLFLAIFDYRLI